jgi:transcriptional regulator with XRE-family HTH domain
MQDLSQLTNLQIEDEIGRRLRARRLDRNLTQHELAERSGIARRTITAIENGEGSSLSTLIALLRALGALGELELLLPRQGPSPMEMLRLREEEPRRRHASKPRQPSEERPWKWGDER